jgi:uroporphyrin-III C-methyltransferase/precorrin-2 dehydrogenase/sirohydrochlorin ferrochelatase
MRYFPIFLDSSKQKYLLIGSGDKVVSKLSLLCQTEASIKLIIDVSLHDFEFSLPTMDLTRVSIEDRSSNFDLFESDLADIDLLYCGIEDEVQIEKIKSLCQLNRVLMNVIDQKEHCDFITPTMIDREPIQIAISTGGHAPILAKSIKEDLECRLEDDLGDFVQAVGGYRKLCLDRLKVLGYSDYQRRAYWQKVLVDQRGDFHSLRGDVLRDALLGAMESKIERKSKVYLIGTGPFDLGYVTHQASHVIAKADVILVDRLSNDEILKKWARKESVIIDVGKKAKCHSIKQEEINALLIRSCLNEDGSQNGKIVVRLKGGDPMVFGRASEEIIALQDAKIDVEVLAGVSAAFAGACQYQIPITSRGVFRKFSILTAQSADGFVSHDWASLKSDAFAIYMGSHVAKQLEASLLNAGFLGSTPICLIKEISTPTAQMRCLTLDQLSETVLSLGAGAMIIYVNVQPLKGHDALKRLDEDQSQENEGYIQERRMII